MGNKLSSLEIERKEKQKEDNAHDIKQKITKKDAYSREQKEVFKDIFNEKMDHLNYERTLISREIRKLRLLQLSKGGNNVITKKNF
jgi:hypothetical protein